jgi:glycosyltransferase involved in cell wall biosynthesis
VKNKKYALVISPVLSSFVISDNEIISNDYHVKFLKFRVSPKYLVFWAFFKQFFQLLLAIPKSAFILIQFGGYWSVVPTLLGKFFQRPTYIILHGTDCCSLPNIPYGSLRKASIRKACKISYENATLLLPVSNSLVKVENRYDSISKQGFKHFFPKLKTPYLKISNGIDYEKWPFSKASRIENSFIAVFSAKQFILKGGDLLFEVASRMKNCTFYIAGCLPPSSLKKIPENLIFLGKLSQSELRVYYSKVSFHMQLSLFEGFGIALCEAMLTGCIPIVSSVNMLPEIIGDSGYILKNRNTSDLLLLIEHALSDVDINDKRLLARKQIVTNYSIKQRELLLKGVLLS